VKSGIHGSSEEKAKRETIQTKEVRRPDLKAIKETPSRFRELFFEANRLCGLVVRVLGYRSGGPGSIPDTTK
jgi:hypothetical protein